MTEVYRESPRSYWSLLWVVGVFAVGAVIDGFLGGLAVHAVGWLIFTAIAAGFWAIVVYAVRAEKTLVVTDTGIRVGDETIPRRDVIGFAEVLDEEELPVLGWPQGKPRQLRGVTVRLANGQDLVVPTRHADRLRAALGIPERPVPAREQDVRAAAKSDLPLLADIADRANSLYRVVGHDPPGTDAAGDVVFVAGRPPVGFVRLRSLDGRARIEQLAVIPRWMRQGTGTRLLERTVEWARRNRLPEVEVVTRSDVPWNAPFFVERGFAECGEPAPDGFVVLRRSV